ncbi:MAG: TonB-dependent siderophore receptor [Prevotella sp.]|jgi:iron complex outermembrane receptor protein|nr:TonB-dependent siderophore receptor [Prevotella sp.]MCH3993464.1 TonB-dependent siderophore receptor [Prevotella sp.]
MNIRIILTSLLFGSALSIWGSGRYVDEEADSTIKTPVQKLNEVVVQGYQPRYTSAKISESLRLDQPLIEIPQNIQVVSKDLMNDMQIYTAEDGIQRTVSGVSKLEHWSDYVRVNMRGSRAAAFREGMNVTSNWGPMTEDMSYVDHIEFVKGPAGFMMSNGEPSGLYNVVTKKPTGQTRGQVGLTFGSYDFYRGTLDLDGKLNKSGKLLYRLNLMGMSSNSQRQYEFTKRYSIAPVLRYIIDDKSVLTFEYDLQYMQTSNIGSYYVFSPTGYATLPRNYSLLEPGLEPTTSYDHVAILNFQHDFNANWKLTAQAAYFNYHRTGSSLWPASLSENGDLIRNISNADVLNEMKFGQLYLNGKEHTGKISHTILAGFDTGNKHAWYDWSQTFQLDSVGTYNIFKENTKGSPYYGYPHFDRSKSLKERANNTQISQSYTGLYLQDVLGLFQDKLRLTLAGRFTYVKDASYGTTKTEVNHFTPRFGLSYSLNATTSLYALYDQTFSPQMGLLRNGKKVKPITGNNWEVGVKRYWWNNHLQTTLSLYRILDNNETSSDPQNTSSESYLIQIGQSVSKGVEFDLNGEILPGLNVMANYAFTDYKVTKSEDPSSPVGTRMPGYAKHEFNFWVRYQAQRGWLKGVSASLGETSLLDRSTWSWGKTSDNVESLPNYIRVDGALGWKNDKISLMLNVNNLLNRYLYSGSYYNNYYYWQSEPPRNFRLSMTYNF